jgi:metabotropic glutamate receptor 2/3/metabotropic glutamate receptor 6/7/8
VYAHALHRLIEKDCPEAWQNKEMLSTCVNTTTLTRNLYTTSFNGSMGYIKFDNLGDFIGGYKILQMQTSVNASRQYKRSPVGSWERITQDTSELTMYPDKVDFTAFKFKPCDREDRPPSVCSLPCKKGEVKIILEQRCCWECQRCDDNEHPVDNSTRCKKCPKFKWPNQETLDSCEEIVPSFLKWDEPMGMILIAFTLFGIALTSFVIAVFIRHRTKRAIRASGRELSMIILIGSMLSYFTVFSIVAKPTIWGCSFQRISFNLSYTLVYASLLTKTNWIYRLFTVVKKGQKKPKLAGAKTQIIFTTMQMIPQVSFFIL